MRGTYKTSNKIKFKTIKLKSNLCLYSDAYILVKGTTTLVGKGTIEAGVQAEKNNEQIIFKNYVPFTVCIINITHKNIMKKILMPWCQCMI